MRVISQKGLPYRDLCYENSTIFIEDEAIFADTLDGGRTLLAQYSSDEKNERAMEMLHEAYTGLIYMKNIKISEEDAEQLKEMLHRGFCAIAYCSNDNSAKIEPMNIVFRFPQEDEIE